MSASAYTRFIVLSVILQRDWCFIFLSVHPSVCLQKLPFPIALPPDISGMNCNKYAKKVLKESAVPGYSL